MSPKIRVSMDSPQKKGRGDYVGLYDTPQELMDQLPWHEGMKQAFEACATEVAHPWIPAKKNQLPMWMGSYLKPGKSSHTKGTYFEPEGASSNFYLVDQGQHQPDQNLGRPPKGKEHDIPH